MGDFFMTSWNSGYIVAAPPRTAEPTRVAERPTAAEPPDAPEVREAAEPPLRGGTVEVVEPLPAQPQPVSDDLEQHPVEQRDESSRDGQQSEPRL